MNSFNNCEHHIGEIAGNPIECGNEPVVKQVLVHKGTEMLGYGINLCAKHYMEQREVIPANFAGTEIEVAFIPIAFLEVAREINQKWDEEYSYNIDNEPCGVEPSAYFYNATAKWYRVMRLLQENQDLPYEVLDLLDFDNVAKLLVIKAGVFYELCRRWRYSQLIERLAIKKELHEKLVPIVFKACVYR